MSTYLSLADWNTTTTDALAEGDTNKYFSNILARAAISFSGLGLDYNNSTGVLSVSSTYNIPLTASTTNWNTFYNTPSTTISLGTGLAWNSNTTLTASTTNWTTAYNTVTASSSNWTSAFDWGNHADAGYLTIMSAESDPIWTAASSTYLTTTTASNTYLSIASNLSDLNSSSTARTNLGLGTLALQNLDGVALTGGSIDGITIGATTPSTAVFTNASSTNFSYSGGLSTPFTEGSVVFAGANGLLSETNSTLFWDGRLGIGTNTFQVTTTPILEVQGVSELKSRVIAGRDISTAGWQTVYSMWAFSGERPVIAKNNTTGKIGYLAEGGTQGIFMGTSGRSIVFDGRTQLGTEKFTASAGDGLIHLDGVADFNNAAVTYRGFKYNFIDSASAAGSLILDLQKSGVSQFVVRKDGNVGINTSTPGYNLTIDGISGATEDALYVTPSTDGTSERAALSLDNWNIGQDYNADGTKNFYIKDTASSTARFFIDKEGNVGIGTTAPSSSLHLASGSFTQTVGSDPSIIGSMASSTLLGGASSVDVFGKYAYVASATNNSLRIIDISDPVNPVIVGGLKDDTNLSGATSVRVSGKYAYVANFTDNSVSIIDVSNPVAPVFVGKVQDAVHLKGLRSIYLSGNYAYAASFSTSSLEIIDVSDPTAPRIVGGLRDTTNLNQARGVYVSGKYAYVATYGNSSLEIIDVSDPTAPVRVGGIKDTTNLLQAYTVYVSGKYAYVASYGHNSLEVIDVSNPTLPIRVGGVADNTLLAGIKYVYVSGNYAYVANWTDESFRIIDISNPVLPVIVGGVENATYLTGAMSVDISGKYAYVASYTDNSFSIIDLSGIDAPTAHIGNMQANDIEVTENIKIGNDAYIGNGLIVSGSGLFGSAMSIAGGLTLTDVTSSLITTVDLNFNNASTTEWTIKLNKSDNKLYVVDNDQNEGVYLNQDETAWTSNSDNRLKDNIMDMSVLERLDGYRAVSFDWISSGKHDVGAIAQELYEIFPEAVSVGNDTLGPHGEGAWGIQYSKLGALALQGVKELKQELDAYNALLLSGGVDGFVNQTTQNNTLTFSQNIVFTEHVSFGEDTVGSALIQAGEDGVLVRFGTVYDTPPIVNLTLASDATLDAYFVDAVDTESFTIRIRPSVSQDIMINWSAFGHVSETVSEAPALPSSSADSGSDSLTDLANNYLTDNGLTLDPETSTTTPISTSTPAEEILQEETPSSTLPIIEEPAPTLDTSSTTPIESL
ncbi:MAG: LVIVD repeat protein [Candidatus Magasanikbacteria bacterium GW2011_GWD2_43_18]|nr:MAG: LVIVD repeat protein [Candidatus Magasanikbacteria bacterium GW2011_GWD2_43_18]